jgi:L-malate glycosyltransferase
MALPPASDRNGRSAAGQSICLVTEDFPPSLGGLGVSAHRVAGFLRDAGFAVHVVVPSATSGNGGTSRESLESQAIDGIEVYRVDPGRTGLETRVHLHDHVKSLDRKIHFALFHGFFLPAVLPCLGPAREGSRPVIASIRGTDANTLIRLPFLRPALLDALRKATWVASVNQYYLDKLAQELDLADRSTVIHNGFPNFARTWKLTPANAGVVGSSGQFRAVKDVPLLVRAFHKAAPAARKLLLVGEFSEPAEEQWSMTLIEEFSLKDRFEITGRLPHSEAIGQLNRMHVYVQSSAFEGVPNALLEAAAVGLPIVATAAGGVPEIFTHGVNALLVPHGDPAALARAIRSVIENERLAEALCRETALLAAKMSSEHERRQWVELHRRLLLNRNEPVEHEPGKSELIEAQEGVAR